MRYHASKCAPNCDSLLVMFGLALIPAIWFCALYAMSCVAFHPRVRTFAARYKTVFTPPVKSLLAFLALIAPAVPSYKLAIWIVGLF
jgi:hypothetical protein